MRDTPDVTFVSWDDMTPEQREYTIYAYALVHIEDTLRWPVTPSEITDRLRELGDVWGRPSVRAAHQESHRAS